MPNGPLQRLADWRARISAVKSRYHLKYGRMPNLLRPALFSEKMQWRKLFDTRPEFTVLSDKFAMRGFARARGCGHLLVPILAQADHPAGIPFADLPLPYALKSTHGSMQFVLARGPADVDPGKLIPLTSAWLARCHGTAWSEPGYLGVPRKLIVEPLLTLPGGDPVLEYKIFVFAGQARVLQCIRNHLDAPAETVFHRPPWQRLNWRSNSRLMEGPAPPPPPGLVAAAERLAAGFDHLRVDFLVRGDEFFLGEITVYSWSGIGGLSPEEADREMGGMWRIGWPLLKALKAVLFTDWGVARQSGILPSPPGRS